MSLEEKKDLTPSISFDEFNLLFQKYQTIFSFKLNEKQINQFYIFFQDLIEANKVINLTSITDVNDVIIKHFIDSISLILTIPDINNKKYTVIDIGTGAGFPGIPLSIAFPALNITLVDSLNKRIIFIKQECDKLGITNIETIHSRAEDLAQNKTYRECYDICVSRAVANLSTLSEYCLPFIHKGGRFIPYKAGDVSEEASSATTALRLLGGKITDIKTFDLPLQAGRRSLILIEKTAFTPHRFPRKAGLPSKNPLGQ